MAKRLSDHVQIRVHPRQVAFWKAVAAEQGVTLSELIRDAADSHARLRLTAGIGGRRNDFESVADILSRALAEVGIDLNELLAANQRPAA